MHMSDALLSPAVGGALWAATAGMVAVAARRVERDPDVQRVPLMGVLGAFVFAAQMVNFSIPGTGSSGHLGGGLLLAVLLGPSAGFLVLASVIAVQALFFGDGGILALGANVFNMGVASCFVAYPLVFRPVAGARPGPGRRTLGAILGGIVSLALGALGVVLETGASGISSLPLGPFLGLMIPIHLAIGVGEGLATAALLGVLWRARPELAERQGSRSMKRVVAAIAAAAAVVAAAGAWLASTAPDGLEWSVARTAGEVGRPAGLVHALLARLQAITAIYPDYGAAAPGAAGAGASSGSLAGLAGAGITLAVVLLAFAALRALRRRARRDPA